MAAIFVGKHPDTVQLLSNRGALAEAVLYNAAVQAVFPETQEHILEELFKFFQLVLSAVAQE
jgi:hypothetical protein